MDHRADPGEGEIEIRIRRSHGPDGTDDEAGADRRGHGGNGTSVWEWVVAALGALLVLGAIGVMLADGLGSEGSAPRIEVSADSVYPSGPGVFAVELRVANHGQRTAAALVVEGRLLGEQGVVETSQVTLDFVPADSHRRAGLFFTRDPRRFSLSLRALGYDVP